MQMGWCGPITSSIRTSKEARHDGSIISLSNGRFDMTPPRAIQSHKPERHLGAHVPFVTFLSSPFYRNIVFCFRREIIPTFWKTGGANTGHPSREKSQHEAT